MSFIPNKAMHHAHTTEAVPAEDGKLDSTPSNEGSITPLNWVLGAAGAGVAVAAVAAAIFSLRGSSSRKPAPRRTRAKTDAKPTKTARRASPRKKAA